MTAGDQVTLRRMCLDDVELLRRWDADPDVAAAIGGAGADWYDWSVELDRELDWRELLVVEHERRPIGFVQLLDAARDESGYWGDVEPGTWSLDIWIGSAADRGQGLGAAAMRCALVRLFEQHGADVVVIDPRVENRRAIAFYRRLGFETVGERVFDDDHCLVMRLARPG